MVTPEGDPGISAHEVAERADSVEVCPEVSTAVTAKQLPAVAEATVVEVPETVEILANGPAFGP